MSREEKAAELFKKGYNCAQSVAVAFCEETGLSEEQAAKLVSGFGGGIGRMREVCGAVSGMVFVLSMIKGYSDPKERDGKRDLYATIQTLAGKFKEKEGSLVCRDLLLGTGADASPTPEERTAEYYKKRGCIGCVECAAGILDEYLARV